MIASCCQPHCWLGSWEADKAVASCIKTIAHIAFWRKIDPSKTSRAFQFVKVSGSMLSTIPFCVLVCSLETVDRRYRNHKKKKQKTRGCKTQCSRICRYAESPFFQSPVLKKNNFWLKIIRIVRFVRSRLHQAKTFESYNESWTARRGLSRRLCAHQSPESLNHFNFRGRQRRP